MATMMVHFSLATNYFKFPARHNTPSSLSFNQASTKNRDRENTYKGTNGLVPGVTSRKRARREGEWEGGWREQGTRSGRGEEGRRRR